ncbi:DUF3168 domain-containing protein [Kaistia sp. MMO-174]|uniref:DUF3168 domain-containing protein n=1 Tax=Kaistia sp. MMO-174 TaxID=3081256 RepID=UPI00301AC032
MSTDPSLALQAGFLHAIVAAVPVLGGRVYDMPPASALYPYVTIGEIQVNADLADCYAGSESFADVHVWSRAVGFPEAKGIADQIRSALHDADLALSGHSLELLQFRDARTLRDPDGITSHIAMTFRALTQPD